MMSKNILDAELVHEEHVQWSHIHISLVAMSIIVTVRHMFALLSLVWHCYHFRTLFRTLWGSKHSFHGNITETHIDKRIGAAVFL